MREFFTMTFSDEECPHEECSCSFSVKGIHATTKDFEFTTTVKGITAKFNAASLAIATSFRIEGGVPIPSTSDMEAEYIKRNLLKKHSMVSTSIPYRSQANWPECKDNYGIDRDTHDSLLDSDVRILKETFGSQFIDRDDLARNVWKDIPPVPTVEKTYTYQDDRGGVFSAKRWDELVGEPSEGDVLGQAHPICQLKHMILKKYSSFHQACGTTNGRSHVIAAMSGMYPFKFGDATVLMNQATQVPPVAFEEIKPLVGPAMDLLYHKMKITEFGKEKCVVNFDPIKEVFHGASSGINFGPSFVISDPDLENSIIVSPVGKKT